MIFISYSWKDKEKVWPVADILKSQLGDDQVYIDNLDNSFGDDYVKNFTEIIKKCDTFLFFNSNNYDNSTACNAEQSILLKSNKGQKILEIKLDETDTPNHLSSRILYYDAIKKDAQEIAEIIINSKSSDISKFKSINDYELISCYPEKETITLRANRGITRVSFTFYSRVKINVRPEPWSGYSSRGNGTVKLLNGTTLIRESITWPELLLRHNQNITLTIKDWENLHFFEYTDSMTGNVIRSGLLNKF